jgi:hypothetical protein
MTSLTEKLVPTTEKGFFKYPGNNLNEIRYGSKILLSRIFNTKDRGADKKGRKSKGKGLVSYYSSFHNR